MNLVPYNKDGLELVIDTNSGETFASISAVARMTDKDKASINVYVNGSFKGRGKMVLKTTEVQTPWGLHEVTLLNEKQIFELIIYYKQSLCEEFFDTGIRTFLHKLVGYEHPPVRQLPVHTAVEYLNASLQIDQITNKTLQVLLRNQLITELSVLLGKSS